MPRSLAALGCPLLLAACAVDMPKLPLGGFENGDVAAMATAAREQVEKGPAENRALVLNVQAQCEQLLGDRAAAFRDFLAAGQMMGNWQTSGGEEFAAIVGQEGSKTWHGDPYEKAMNAFYLAVNCLWRGEPDNARAALKKGILADAEVGDEKFQADNPLLFWLAGRMSRLMGKPDDAKDFFAEAQKANTFAMQHGSRGDGGQRVLGDPGHGNLVLLVECGMGPEKFAGGSMGELACFRPRWQAAQRCVVTLDGRPLGETVVLCDVDYQATTRGGTVMEGIRKGKAVFKVGSIVAGEVLLQVAAADARRNRDRAAATAVVGGGLLLLGLLTSTEADVRHWPTLPSTVQAMTLDATPGTHQLDLRFVDPAGREIPGFAQHWAVEVAGGAESYYLFRSLPGLDRLATTNAAQAGTIPSKVGS